MLIRFKHWDTDGVPAHKAIRGAVEYLFLDSAKGLCDVRDREGIAYLLARSANYELAYEVFGIAFDADGHQVTPQTTGVIPAVDVSAATVAASPVEPPPFPKRKPGRPRKG